MRKEKNMTLEGAIKYALSLKGRYTYGEEKVREWLTRLDGSIIAQIIDNYEDSEEVYFEGYTDSTVSEDTELVVPSPWDALYLHWIEAQTDYANGEYDRYNNSAQAYSDAYEAYARYYHRTHMPRTKRLKY